MSDYEALERYLKEHGDDREKGFRFRDFVKAEFPPMRLFGGVTLFH